MDFDGDEVPPSTATHSTSRCTYDVFLSFRGADTRNGFTGHLYSALLRSGIHTFLDDKEMETGGEVGPECLRGIEESRFSIVVLSKRYASSVWCLEELVHILNCRRYGSGHGVWPVFYDVDPSDVEECRGSFDEAFAQHEADFSARIKEWKAALREVSYLKGLDVRKHADGNEAKSIELLVDMISKRLDRKLMSVARNPVAVRSRAQPVISFLQHSSEDVRILGIYGMGGVGKTTVAKEAYNSVFNDFEGACFLANVREQSMVKGIAYLQRKLLSEILKRKYDKFDNADIGLKLIRDRLRRKRVLLVLDDVDSHDQVKKVLGNLDWLSPGSRVLITTRTKNLLQPSEMYWQYKVRELDESDSLQLLSLHAFDSCDPPDNYVDCARKVLCYTGGVPLALEVLGCLLRGQAVGIWNVRMEKLKRMANDDIQSVLKLSYHSLDDTEKFMFLDIACFFIGFDKDYVMSILEGCGFFPADGIHTLVRRGLVKVGYDNKLWMHDLLQGMGREIVREESPADPGERSRVWHYEDVTDVLTSKTGTKAIEGLAVNLPHTEQLSSSAKAFKKMKRLRLLKLSHVVLKGSYEHFCNKLRWLCWHGFSLESIPDDFDLGNLIALDLRHSRLKTFSEEEVKSMKKLKYLDLSHSLELLRTPNFTDIPRVAKLRLKGCISLEEVHDSIGSLTHLRSLDLQGCQKLKQLPARIFTLTSLKKIDLSGCSSLEELPPGIENLESLLVLLVDGTALRTLPETTSNLGKLKSLSLQQCDRLFTPRTGPSVINFLPSSLIKLDLRSCNITDDTMPDNLGFMPLLNILKLCGNDITCLPESINALPELGELWLNKCQWLREIPELQSSVKSLHANHCTSLQTINLRNWPLGSGIHVEGCSSLEAIEGFFSLETVEPETIELLKISGFSTLGGSMSDVLAYKADSWTQTHSVSPLQAVAERGLYSMFFPGNEIPAWFTHQTQGDRISYRVPALDQGRGAISGIVTCAVYAWERPLESCFFMPYIRLVNRTKMLDWDYAPHITFFMTETQIETTWLCHWRFDSSTMASDHVDRSLRLVNETEGGDEIEFTVEMGYGIAVKKCAILPLYGQVSTSLSKLLATLSSSSSKHHTRMSVSSPQWLRIEDHGSIIGQIDSFGQRGAGYKEWKEQRSKRLEHEIHDFPTVQMEPEDEGDENDEDDIDIVSSSEDSDSSLDEAQEEDEWIDYCEYEDDDDEQGDQEMQQ
ncbi:Disease resistance protein RUN1 [Linum perenne]